MLQLICKVNGKHFEIQQHFDSEVRLHILVQSLSPANLLKLFIAALLEHK